MKPIKTILFFFGATLFIGCAEVEDSETDTTQDTAADTSADTGDVESAYEDIERRPNNDEVAGNPLCSGEILSTKGVEAMLPLTAPLKSNESIYTIYDRIDGIASLFEDCGDPWGMFPTAYRHITRRIIKAIDGREIEDSQWGKDIVLDFASRYLYNLELALTNGRPSYAWTQYYYLADNGDVSRTRAVVVAMVAHLTLDLPYALVEIDSQEEHKDDYFVLGELMIEITPDFIQDLRDYYDTDAEAILNGFFMGKWIDGAFGKDTTITLSYQTIRTKSWNNRWLLQQWWGVPVAEGEIYTAFWAIDGVLATLDATGKI